MILYLEKGLDLVEERCWVAAAGLSELSYLGRAPVSQL